MEFFVVDKLALPVSQSVLDCKFNLEQNKNVAKVLSVSVKPYLTSSEVVTKEVRYQGKVYFKLIYLTEEGEVVVCESITDFNSSVACEEYKAKMNANVTFKVVDVTTPAIKSNEVRVACVIDATTYLEVDRAMQEEVSLQPDIFVKRGVTDIWEDLASIDEVFDVVEEIKIKDNLDRIISYDVDVSVKDMFGSVGFICISGDMHYSFIYEKEDNGEKVLCHYEYSQPFKQEMTLSNCKKECYVNCNANVNVSNIKINVIMDNANNIVKIECPVRVCGNVYENKLVECVLDAYSTDYEVECKESDIVGISNMQTSFFEENISNSIEVTQDETFKVVGYTAPSITQTGMHVNDDVTTIEGILSVNILLKKENGYHGMQSDIPFAITRPNMATQENKVELALLDLKLNLSNNNIEVNARVAGVVTGYDKIAKKYISEVVKTNEKVKEDCAIEIIVAKENQTLWEIGKYFNVSEEALLSQNKELTLPLKEGDKLIIYRQKVAQF